MKKTPREATGRHATKTLTAPTKAVRHKISTTLQSDARFKAMPRLVHVIQEEVENKVFCLKFYPAPDKGLPASELMTLSLVNAKTAAEYEFRFDERFAVSFKFKKQSDPERIAFVEQELKKRGGVKALDEVFSDIFPEISTKS